jgi:hypothetical protein
MSQEKETAVLNENEFFGAPPSVIVSDFVCLPCDDFCFLLRFLMPFWFSCHLQMKK